MPFGWLFLSFFSHSSQELTKTNAVLFPNPRYFFFFFFKCLGSQMRKKGRESDIQGCRVQLCRLRTLQGMQQKVGRQLKFRPHSPCPNVCSGLEPRPLRGGVDPEALSQPTLVLPTWFLSSSFSLSSLLFTLAKNLYEISCNLFFSLRKG